MNFIFPYLDILILAFLAIFLGFRLKNLLGHKSGYEQDYNDENKNYDKNKENKIIAIHNKKLEGRGIKIIKKADKNFSEEEFISGVSSAFKIIVKAFSDSDLDTLRQLLGYDLLKNFTKAITERTALNEIHETKILSIENIEIVDSKLSSNLAFITVVITSKQSKVVKNIDGNIIDGNINNEEIIKDKWTFEKDISNTNPNWKLVETDSVDW